LVLTVGSDWTAIAAPTATAMTANASAPRPRPLCRLTTKTIANAAYPGKAEKWPVAYPAMAAPDTSTAATG
jgi:hypothetical protein